MNVLWSFVCRSMTQLSLSFNIFCRKKNVFVYTTVNGRIRQKKLITLSSSFLLHSSPHLSFSFAFFVHGESTVCASMDIREHPPIRPLTEEYLNEVIKNTQQNMDNCSLNDDEEKEDFNDNHTNVSMQTVILAPFGLSAVLTGNRSESGEQFTEKFLNDWNNFYPMKDSSDTNTSQSKLPPLVEVNSGEK